MENLEPSALAALVGAVILLIGQLVKKTGIEGKYVAAALAVLAGVAYTAFKQLVPLELQTSVVGFTSTAFATSWFLFEMIWKPVRARLQA